MGQDTSSSPYISASFVFFRESLFRKKIANQIAMLMFCVRLIHGGIAHIFMLRQPGILHFNEFPLGSRESNPGQTSQLAHRPSVTTIEGGHLSADRNALLPLAPKACSSGRAGLLR